MRIDWAGPAVADLEAIWDYVAEDSPEQARLLIRRLVDAVEPLRDFARMGRVVPEIGEEHLRELLVESYRVLYELQPDRLTILAIAHGARDLRRGLPPWERLPSRPVT